MAKIPKTTTVMPIHGAIYVICGNAADRQRRAVPIHIELTSPRIEEASHCETHPTKHGRIQPSLRTSSRDIFAIKMLLIKVEAERQDRSDSVLSQRSVTPLRKVLTSW